MSSQTTFLVNITVHSAVGVFEGRLTDSPIPEDEAHGLIENVRQFGLESLKLVAIGNSAQFFTFQKPVLEASVLQFELVERPAT